MIFQNNIKTACRKFLTITAIFCSSWNLSAFADKTDHQTMILAGGAGSTSSASARVTLIIPPRPTQPAKQAASKESTSTPPEEDTKGDK